MPFSQSTPPFKATAIAVALLSAGGLSGQAAWAQSELVLEEVVVTAQKREQSAQDIPSSVSVIGAEMLEDFSLRDFSALELVTPGLVTDNLDARSGSVSLRGVDYNPNSAAAQAVDIYWNDTPVSSVGGGVFQQLFDLERIEALKGPQGTLQGRSSPAGAIVLHTAKPSMDEIEGNVSAEITDNSGINTSAAISLPIVAGTLSTRIAAVFDDSDLDEAENIVTGSTRSKESKAGRFSVSWLPTDALSIDLAYQYLDNQTVDFNILQGSPLQDTSLPTLSASDRKGIQVNDALGDSTYQRASLQLSWDIGNHTLNWLSGWSDVESSVPAENLNSEANQDPAESQRQILNDTSQFKSQELRLSNSADGTWEYMVGLYWAESKGDFTRFDFPINDTRPDRDRHIVTPFNQEATAVFTHNIIHLTDAWTAQLGLRWQNNKDDIRSDIFAGDRGLFGVPAGEFFVSLVPEEFFHRDEDSVTGAVNLQYQFNDSDLMLYGSYSTGYRPGGVTVAAVNLGDLVAFNEEDSWAVEFGFKSRLMDGRARFNGAVFYQEFDDFIARAQRVAVSTSANSSGITANADAEIVGAELELDVLLTERLRFGGGISYNQAEFKSGQELPCTDLVGGVPVIPAGAIAATCDVGGRALGPQPDLLTTMNAEYTMPFSAFEAYGRGLFKYVGERDDIDIGKLDAYQTFDLYLGLRSESRQWDISLFAKNLFDEDQVIRANSIGLHRRQPTGYQAVDLVTPRLIGLKANYRF